MGAAVELLLGALVTAGSVGKRMGVFGGPLVSGELVGIAVGCRVNGDVVGSVASIREGKEVKVVEGGELGAFVEVVGFFVLVLGISVGVLVVGAEVGVYVGVDVGVDVGVVEGEALMVGEVTGIEEGLAVRIQL